MIAVDTALVDRVEQIIREIQATETARLPIGDEVSAELARIDLLTVRSRKSSTFWLGSPSFSERAFDDSVIAAMMLVAPDATRALISDHVKQRAEAWKGLRLAEAERQRRLVKLQGDLHVARARLEQARRAIEETTGEMLPRQNDDPLICLLRDQPLAELAAGKTPR